MIPYFESMEKIQVTLGETESADGIEEESWLDTVVKTLDTISKHFSTELEREPGAPEYLKPYGKVPYMSMPPMRLLSLAVLLNAWLGWVLHEKGLDIYGEFKLNESYEFGRILSLEGITP